MALFSDWTTLISAFFLLITGTVLLGEWAKKYKESFFYWGFGLLVWGASLVMRFFIDTGILQSTYTVSFIFHYLFGLAFVFFLLYGTLILILKKSHANKISIIYFIAFFFVNSIMGGLSKNEAALSVWHNVLFITPPALVLGIYFFYYYKKLKKIEIMALYSFWILFAILAYIYTFIFALGIASPESLRIWNIGNNITIIMLSLTYFLLIFGQKETWHAITQIAEYKIDETLLEFFQENFFERAEEIIKQEMQRINISKLNTASKVEREVFVENCIRFHFSKIASLQRQEIIRARLLSLLGVRIDSSEDKDYGINLVRM